MFRANVLLIAGFLVACSGETTDEYGHANEENPVVGGDAAVEPEPAGETTISDNPPGKDPPVDAGELATDAGVDSTVSVREFTLTVSREGGNGSGKVVGTASDAQVVDCEGGR